MSLSLTPEAIMATAAHAPELKKRKITTAPAVGLDVSTANEILRSASAADVREFAAAALDERVASADAAIRYVLDRMGDRVALTTSFGMQSALMLHLVTRHKPDIPVIWIDTGFLPAETYHYARTLEKQLGLNIQIYQASMSPAHIEAELGPKLWERDHKAYGRITKVEPMGRALRDLGGRGDAPPATPRTGDAPCAVLVGLRKGQTANRQKMQKVNLQKAPTPHYKVCPVLDWSAEDVDAYFERHGLPQHPLKAQGYTTVGDAHSSAPADANLSELEQRASRFGGKVQECGLHIDETDEEDGPEAPAAAAEGGDAMDHASTAPPAAPTAQLPGVPSPPALATPPAAAAGGGGGATAEPSSGGFTVFGRKKCGWCAAVKAELRLAGHHVQYVDAEERGNGKALVRRLRDSGAQHHAKPGQVVKVPQVFYGAEHVGAFEETMQLVRVLARQGARAPAPAPPSAQAPQAPKAVGGDAAVFSGEEWIRHLGWRQPPQGSVQ
eukprot:g137.t1